MTKKNSLLWEIHQNNVFKGYLFGTMHVPGEIAFSNFDNIYKAIDQCQVLATEIELNHQSQKEMGKHMNLPQNVSISQLLSEKKYSKFKAILKKAYDIDLDVFDKILPLFLINFMTQLSLDVPQRLLHLSMDMQCYKYAESNGKKMDSVESLEDHINTLYSIPIDYQIKAMKQAIADVGKFRLKSKKMLKLYQTQNVHELYKQSKKSLAGIKETLLYSRNKIMLKNIQRIVSENTVFIAVGAGHLSGKKGLLHELKTHGFSIKSSPLSKEL